MLSTIEDGYAVNKYNENAFDINILDEVTKKFKKLIKTDTNVETYPDKGNENFRYWKCMNYMFHVVVFM